MRQLRFTVLVGATLVALSGCADLRLANLQAELEQAEARWQQAGIDDYAYTFQWVCFCPYEQVRITVRGGLLESVETVPPGQPPFDPSSYGPVEDLFALLRDAIDQQAFEIVVEYDPATGVPAMSSIDYLRYVVDEERGFVLEDFAELPTVAATVAPSRP